MSEMILIIDDDDVTRETTAELLRLSDYDVRSANSGEKAIGIIHEETPDLILCDIAMPGIDGYMMLEWVMSNVRTCTIPFIFLTASGNNRDMRRGMMQGADDYITKPYVPSELLMAIDARLKRRRPAQSPATDRAGAAPLDILKAKEHLNNEIVRIGKEVLYSRNKTIFREGSFNRMLFLITSGSVKTYKTNDTGKVCITGIFTNGHIVGNTLQEPSDNNFNSASAIEDCSGYLVSRGDLQTLLKNNIECRAGYMNILANKASWLDKQMITIAYPGVRKRVADTLLCLYDIYTGRAGNVPTSIPLPAHDLACMCGMTGESAYRVVSAFEKEGLIMRDLCGHIVITDPVLLSNVTDGKPRRKRTEAPVSSRSHSPG